MSDITLSAGVRSNLLQLQSTADLIGRTQTRLATGKKVNSALDNPTNFFTSTALSSRAGDLSRLLDSVGNAIKTIEQADNGIKSLTKLVESAQATARQALQAARPTATYSAEVAGTQAFAADAAGSATGAVVDIETTYENAVEGTAAFTADSAGSVEGSNAFNADQVQVFTSTAIDDVSDLAASGQFDDGDAFTIAIDGGGAGNELAIAVSTGMTGAQLVDAINNDADNGGRVVASLGANDELVLTGGDTNTTFTVTADGGNTGTIDFEDSAVAAENLLTQGLSQGDTLDITVGGSTTSITFGTGNGEVSTQQELLDAINAVDGLTASFNGDGELVIDGDDASVAATFGGDGATALGLGASLDTENLITQGVAEGDTLEVTVGGNTTTITFGYGAGQVSTQDGLVAALEGINGVTAEFDGDGNLNITSAGSDDLTVAGDAATTLGVAVADQAATVTGITGANQGETLTVSVNGGAATTLTFGTGAGEIGTTQGLVDALNAIEGVSASINGDGELEIDGADASTGVAFGGTAAAGLGLDANDVEATNLLSQGVSQGQTLTIDLGGTTSTITFGTGAGEVSTREGLEAAISAISGVTGAFNADGELEITSTNAAALSIGGTAAGALGVETTEAVVPEQSVTTANGTRASLESDYNEVIEQISQLVADASFNGVNLLNGDDLTVLFNEDGSSSFDVTGVTFDAAGLGLAQAASGSFQSDADLNSTLDDLSGAITALRTQASRLGSGLSIVQTRQEFTKATINTLQVGADQLVLADTNEEGANLLALQTRQQLSTTALSLASQADQNVLRLF